MSVVNNKRYDGIKILRVVLFIGIVAFHSGVPCSQMCGWNRGILCY